MITLVGIRGSKGGGRNGPRRGKSGLGTAACNPGQIEKGATDMEPSPGDAAGFKTCPSCEFRWGTRQDFLRDSGVELIGYQVHFEALEEGLFLFNCRCRTTLSIRAGIFSDLYAGQIFSECATGTEECPEHCLHATDLQPCPARCECAYVREVIQIVRQWPKLPPAERR
jgi:hypothetical protein